MIEKQIPDLLLLDIMMPGVDGIQVCHKLQSNPDTQGIPILFVSAKSTKEGKLEGLDAGAIDYITKPIDTDEVVARIRAHIRYREMLEQCVRRSIANPAPAQTEAKTENSNLQNPNPK